MKKIALVLCGMLLAGCASQPKSVILNPVYKAGKVADFNVPVTLAVEDHRISKFTIKVVDQEPAEYLPDAALSQRVQMAFEQALKTNGAQLTEMSNNTLTLHIDSFNSKVTESYTQHESNAVARFKVLATQGKRSFEKTYTGQAQMTGPLKHEQAKVEGQLNKLSEQVITRIVSDPALINFFKG
ncbi:hypothetical protein C1E23_05910 [Pseudoalteromonas phenolica]|uniref:Lipoprotein n=1 Tax=Pseudoalteromonas phenolica TaxID=161398 RepID=A0A4Q7IPD3_9GAMM|nr:YajG family lipoprotein [Pseudoalteromonas phenolica]RZQ54154.1 hypothetical protein C1E23_05910 [Pseudoalteromonas phenolica]